MDLAGVLVDVGKDVKQFKEGDQVFASAFLGFKFGASAEFICRHENGLIAMKQRIETINETLNFYSKY